MNTHWISWAAAPALVAPLLLDAGAGQDSKLVRVQDAQSSTAFDASSWKTRLAARDLEARERDFDALVAELGTNEAARKQVEAWGKDDSSPELAWTSRLLLRASRERGRGPFPSGALPWSDLRSRFDDLQRRFDGMDSLLDDARRQLERAQRQGGTGVAPQGGNVKSQSQRYSMQVGPDGVKVEVQEDVDGKQETKSYTAKTLDDLYAAHPELRDKLGAHVEIQSGPFWDSRSRGGMLDLFGRDGSWWSGSDDGNDPQDLRLRRALPLGSDGMRTDILGVVIQAPSDDQRRELKLDDGVGLMVEGVQPGTIAHKIGVAQGDCLVELNGKVLKSREDVRAVLGARGATEDVSVTLVDPSGKRRTLTWRAPSSPDDARKF